MASATALINVLIQGLFFLEYKPGPNGEDQLLISAPYLGDHYFMISWAACEET